MESADISLTKSTNPATSHPLSSEFAEFKHQFFWGALLASSHHPSKRAVPTTPFILQPSPLISVTTSGTRGITSQLPVQAPSSTGSVDPGLIAAGFKFAPALLQQRAQPALQVTSQPPKPPSLVLSPGPNTAPPLSRASSWYTAHHASGDQRYVSSLINLYPECGLDLEASYDSPANLALVSYDDLQEAPSDSEADPAESEDHSYRKNYYGYQIPYEEVFHPRA